MIFNHKHPHRQIIWKKCLIKIVVKKNKAIKCFPLMTHRHYTKNYRRNHERRQRNVSFSANRLIGDDCREENKAVPKNDKFQIYQ